MFGAFAAKSQQPAFPSFSQPQQQQGTQQGSLFTQGQQQPLFGQSQGVNQQQTTSQPLFGSNTQTNSQPSGLFGSQQQQQPSLFSSFGGTANNQQQSQSQPQQQQQQSAFGSFAPKPLQSQPSNFGSFGTTNNQSAPSLFDQNQSQQQQQQCTGPALFTRTTKFNDLPEDVRKKLEAIDTHIQGRVQICTELKQHKLGDEPVKGSEQIRSVHKVRDLVNAIIKLRADVASMSDLQSKMEQSVQDTIVATRIVDGFRNPQQNGAYLKAHANFPLEYFARVTEELRDRLQWFNATVEQIERKITSATNHASITPQAIAATLQAQHASFVALAAKTAQLDADLTKLKTTYTQLWRAKTGSARDPFNQHDRGPGAEFGLDGLSIQSS
ncbi:hypothetical protein BD410DRAFT_887534 [Rickenella mellea]|uniref:Uncharacterized protein n=1 Tax=Rickenella mellea TaxID=50990 RepID=A0A4Y7QF39_9AGAM|nr:hypothetical protein BD410DRAFT_887534 [Rickenella mellea]